MNRRKFLQQNVTYSAGIGLGMLAAECFGADSAPTPSQDPKPAAELVKGKLNAIIEKYKNFFFINYWFSRLLAVAKASLIEACPLLT